METKEYMIFFKSDEDTDPYKELAKRQLTNETRDSLEGEISLQELTKALNEDMNGTSAPGVDGFTVNFIRNFWTTRRLSHKCSKQQ